ncbi:MAG: signal peptide peptidase SppA [Deltaproteobacteria bacterium]|nr:signal peptide peptidase SppA [Deltaproteobacteria bacterium]
METFNESTKNPSGAAVAAKPVRWWRRPAGIILIVFLSFFFLFFAAGIAAITALIQSAGQGIAAAEELREERISGSGKTKVVMISISGVILERVRTPFFEGAVTADRVIEQLQMAGRAADVAAVLMRVDSPGGSVTASDRIHREVEKLRAKKKVVVLMGDTAASGGYYVSVAAHKIFAHPTSVTGSIGVIVNSINVHDLIKQFGVQSVTIKSSEYKDLLSPFKSPAELEADKAVYRQIVMKLYDRFVMLVSRGRGIPLDKARALADGRIYDAQSALSNGLIDEIGYQDDVLSWLKKKLGKDRFTLIEYTRPLGIFSRLFLESAQSKAPRVSFSDALGWLELGSRPMYLWLPGI